MIPLSLLCFKEKDCHCAKETMALALKIFQANKRVIVPKEALNIDNKWRFIVNSANHTQTVTIEECVG